MIHARAYVNHGRWIADCPQPYCGNAEKLDPHQAGYVCSNCGWAGPVEWPWNPDELWTALAARPVPQTRNWFPPGHNLAVRGGLPHGQSPSDLEAETRQYQGGQ